MNRVQTVLCRANSLHRLLANSTVIKRPKHLLLQPDICT